MNVGKKLPCIVNLDHDPSRGTHWVGFFPDGKYFDSFGNPPPQEIVDEKKGRVIAWNNQQIQELKSQSCGFWVVFWILCILDGCDFRDFLLQLDLNDFEKNERLLWRLFGKKAVKML